MPDRGKERDGTDGIVLPSNLLLRWEQTAATRGHVEDPAPATPPSLTCSRAPSLGSCPPFWGQPCRELGGVKRTCRGRQDRGRLEVGFHCVTGTRALTCSPLYRVLGRAGAADPDRL